MTQKDQEGKVAQVVLELRGNIAYVTFDHVAARNAMTVAMYESLKSICLVIA
jgi:enoyl-CoA hydratase/carnithine racemase